MSTHILVDQVAYLSRYLHQMGEAMQELLVSEETKAAFPALEPEISFPGSDPTIFLQVSSIKDSFPVLGFLRRKGYKYHSHFDYPESQRRYYIVRHLETNQSISISVCLKSKDAKCHFQITGYETIQKPIYKLVCEDGNETAPTAETATAPSVEETETPTSPSSSLSEPSLALAS